MFALKSPITYGELKKKITHFYRENNIKKEEEIDFLIKEVINKDEAFLILNRDKYLKIDEKKKLNTVLRKRKKKIPLPYILGYSYFWKSKFYVSKDVLIPRKETEFLVEEGIYLLKEKYKEGLIIEPCIGSGAVLISLLKELKGNFYGIGVDISLKALKIAKKNITSHNLKNKIKLINGDLLKPISPEKIREAILIVINPPYISEEEMRNIDLEAKSFEPEMALYGGKDGLNFYREILSYLCKIKYSNLISFEIGYNQFDNVIEIGKKYGFNMLNFRKDFLGYRRIVTFRSKNG